MTGETENRRENAWPEEGKRRVRVAAVLAELIVAAALVGGIWSFREDLSTAYRWWWREFRPCGSPIAYSIGEIDERFGLSRDEVRQAADEAAAAWNQAVGRTLLTEVTDGHLPINLIYDYRQKATDQLKEMGIVIERDQAGYDRLHDRYVQMKADYDRRKAEHEADVRALDARRAALESEVERWNARGGAPANQYERLMAEQDDINREVASVNAQADEMNRLAGQINSLVTTLNMLAESLNLQAEDYGDVIEARGHEFEEGHYRSEGGEESIAIFEFEDKSHLVRVLSHEFGHAIGLEHTESPEDIMYRLNEGDMAELSSGDLEALKNHCRLP